MTNYVDITTRSAWLWTEFGSSFAARIIPAEILDSLPRYVRGPKKGQIKDHKIAWKKVERGGWDVDRGCAENRVGKVILAQLVWYPWGREPQVIADYMLDKDNTWKRW